MWCLWDFDFQTCFARQQRALFRHLNFQKRSDPEEVLRVWLPNVLRATTPCAFSTSQLPKVLRNWRAFNRLRNALHATTAYTFLSISTFKSALNLRCFYPFLLPNPLRATMARNFSCQTDGSAPAALASLLFGATKYWKDTAFCDLSRVYLFANLHLLSSDPFSSLIFFLLPSLLWLFPPPYCCRFDC